MTNPFDTMVAQGTFGDCDCSALDIQTDEDIRCPNPATIVTPEGWIICQQHAELIDACAKIMEA